MSWVSHFCDSLLSQTLYHCGTWAHNSVCKVTGQLEFNLWRGIVICLFTTLSRMALGLMLLPLTGCRSLFPEWKKWLECNADCSRFFVCGTLPPYSLYISWYSVKHRKLIPCTSIHVKMSNFSYVADIFKEPGCQSRVDARDCMLHVLYICF
jgi:hypothetical protein